MNRFLQLTLASLALAAFGSSAFAQVTIDQNKAMAGNVTPGDAAGFPVTISQPGHYKLTSNLIVPAATQGIVITAENVTLDLNGFGIIGQVSCDADKQSLSVSCQGWSVNSLDMSAVLAQKRAVVRNGFARGFEGAILNMKGSNSVVERVHTSHGFAGIRLAAGGHVVDSSVELIVHTGIAVSRGGVVRGSRATYVNGGGIYAPLITDSSVEYTAGHAFTGSVRSSHALANKGGFGGTKLSDNVDQSASF
jgi:hypothetical protein